MITKAAPHAAAAVTMKKRAPAGRAPAGSSLAAATDMAASTAFVTQPAYSRAANDSAPPAADGAGWLQLDFGREVFLSRVIVRVATAASVEATGLGPLPQAVLDSLLVGVTVEGFDDASYMPAEAPLVLGALGSL